MDTEKGTSEEFKISGDLLVKKVRELIHEGNVRRIIVKNEEGRTLMEIPLTVGLVGAVLLPIWAALGALAALAGGFVIQIERTGEPAQPPAEEERPAPPH